MSTHALSWAWRQEVGDAGAKLVLLKLADQANDRGECFPSHRTLAAECEMGRRTVQRKLEILYAAGLVSAEPRTRATGGDSSLLYRVGIHAVASDGGEQMSAAVRQVDAPPCATGDAPPAPTVAHHEPSLEPSSPADAGEGTASAALELGEIPEILEEKFGRVVPRTNAHARRRKAIADLRRLEATPATVRQAIVAWDGRFPGATLTDIALATHFPQLAAAVAPQQSVPVDPAAVSRSRARDAATGVVLALRRAVCQECEVGGGRHSADCTVATETPARAYRRWVTDHAADTEFPLEEVHLVIDEWRDLDDVDRSDLHDLATETRARIPHVDEEAA